MLTYQYSWPAAHISEEVGGKKKSALYFVARTEMTRLESFSLQNSGRKKNPIILTWPLDLEVHSSKPKIPDATHFEESLYFVVKYKQEDSSEN